MGTGNNLYLSTTKESIFFIDQQFIQIDADKKWIKTDKKLFNNNTKNTVDLYVDSPLFTLIPNEIFNQIDQSQKRAFLTNEENNFFFHHSTVPSLDTQLFWAIKKEDEELFKNKIPGCTFHHFTEPIILNNKEEFSVKYYSNNNFIYIFCFKNKSLCISNRFEIQNNDDALYFILNLIKESDLINSKLKIQSYGLRNNDLEAKLASIFKDAEFNKYSELDFYSFFL